MKDAQKLKLLKSVETTIYLNRKNKFLYDEVDNEIYLPMFLRPVLSSCDIALREDEEKIVISKNEDTFQYIDENNWLLCGRIHFMIS